MLHSLKSLVICSTVVFNCLCIECVDFQNQLINSNLSEASMKVTPSFLDTKLESIFHSVPVYSNKTHEEIVKNFSFTRPFNTDHEVSKTTLGHKELTEFAMEGGGIGFPLQNSSDKIRDDGVVQEEFHNKGSKGRKGVSSSSVVPRKGVSVTDQFGELQSNNTTTRPRPMEPLKNGSLSNNDTKTVMDGKVSLSTNYESTKPQGKVQMQEVTSRPRPVGILNTTHSKKPEYVSDEKDVNDFDKYSIIKTSTTGEDYVIIGIVIVIGIWFSVFGALIFYRRAGEYWDRRHYRRMDFLVEGMYND